MSPRESADPHRGGLARIGDTIRERLRDDVYTLLGHHQFTGGGPGVSWQAKVYPRTVALGEPSFELAAYDFTERDIAEPGALIAFADPWSTWTEDR